MSYGYYERPNANFEQNYRCYPPSFIEKPHLESGDKVLMPPSALDRLASLHIEYPMLFELNNPSSGRVSHCGVLEFVADEGLMYLPYWMMKNMLLKEGDVVQVKNTSLQKGTYVKLQPHTKDFLDISNPKAVLETTLRSFSCLTTGDTIMVAYNNKKFHIDIVETKPSPAISIIETDCEVDFAAPLDYKEAAQPEKSNLSNKKRTLTEAPEEPVEKIAKFNPFTGTGRRLDGKPSMQSEAPVSLPSPKQHRREDSKDSSVSKDSKPSDSSSHRHGTLVFGTNEGRPPNKKPKVSPKNIGQEQPQEVDKSAFAAFTGKKYSLRG